LTGGERKPSPHTSSLPDLRSPILQDRSGITRVAMNVPGSNDRDILLRDKRLRRKSTLGLNVKLT
jgi:hypothetical protein